MFNSAALAWPLQGPTRSNKQKLNRQGRSLMTARRRALIVERARMCVLLHRRGQAIAVGAIAKRAVPPASVDQTDKLAGAAYLY
jgi:hypothetical protein